MVGKIKNLVKNPIFSGLLIVSTGNVMSSFLSYYFNFLTQSLFPDFSEFGDFIFILTFLTISQIIPGSISGTLNLIVTELKVKNEYAKLTLLYIKMLVLFSVAGFVLGFFVFVISNQIADIFQIKNVLYIQLMGLLIFLTTAGIPQLSFLYGLLKFKSYSIVVLLGIILKICFTLYFYKLGFGFASILYGFISSSITSFIVGNMFLVTHFDPKYRLNNVSEYTKRLILFSFPMFFILVGSAVLNQLDFLIIKNKLDPMVSGMYGYLINFGKIFYFGSLIFCGAMAPQVTESLNKKENYFKILFFYLKIVLSIVVSGLIFLGIFTKQFLDLFVLVTSNLGLKLSSLMMFYKVIDYIPLYTIFIGIYVLINFMVIFLIATSSFKIYISFILSAILQSILIFTLANDIYTTIYLNIAVSSILLVYLTYEIYKRYVDFNNSSRL